MTDSMTAHARMTHGYRRRIAVIGFADTFRYRLHPAFRARLGPVRPRAHAAAKSIIS
jgi:hypothetical protein